MKVNINHTTFDIVLKNRNNREFKKEKFVQALLDNSIFENPGLGYISQPILGEAIYQMLD